MSIISIDLSKLRNAEFLQFSTDASGIITLNAPASLGVDIQLQKFSAITSTIEALFKTAQGSAITAEIEALDARRDQSLTGISTVVSGYRNHYDPQISSSAAQLADNLSIYGTALAHENYQSETAIINSIYSDWTLRPPLAQAVGVLQLAPWLQQLNDVNNQFNARYLARTQELGAASADTIKAKRKKAVEAWYELRNMINAHFVINNGSAPFMKVTQELNALIESYNRLLSGRATEAPAGLPAV